MRRGAPAWASTAGDIRSRNQKMLMNYTSMNDGALLEDPNNTWYDEELHAYYVKTRIDARLATHMDSIADFAKSKFPGDKVFYTVKLAHIKKEPLYLGLDEPWALSKWKACVWRYDKPRHYRYEMVATPHFAHEHMHDIRVAAQPDRSIESYMDSFHKDDTKQSNPGRYEASQMSYSLPQPLTTSHVLLQDAHLQDLEKRLIKMYEMEVSFIRSK